MTVGDEEIDGDDYMAVLQPVWDAVSIYDSYETYESDLAPFTLEQRLLLACAWYLAEVDNGGHDQFYFNSTGIVWSDALEGFRAMGAPEAAELIAESARRLGGKPSFDRERREEQLDAFAPDFDDLDSRLYDLEQDGALEARIMAYVRAHRHAFYHPPRALLGGDEVARRA
jgi:hypothetical protein